MSEISIPPLIYLRQAGRTAELCIKPHGECIQTYPLSESQLRAMARDSVNFALKDRVDVKV